MRAIFLALLFLALSVGTVDAKAKKSKEKADEEPAWDVNDPPGEWTDVEIDTTETTWSDVDVSPDGATIVFDMLGDIYTVPIEGGEATALTGEVAWNFQPRFSPDGKQIAFVSDRGGGDNLWVMNADGSDPRAVTEEKENLVHNPAWSPDGEYLAGKKGFTSTRSIPAGEIWLFHVGGGGGLQLTERPHKDKDQKTMAEPAFSMDGRYVYYSQDVTPGRVWQYNKDSTGGIFAIKRLDRPHGRGRHLRQRRGRRDPAHALARRTLAGVRQAHSGLHQRALPEGSRVRTGSSALREARPRPAGDQRKPGQQQRLRLDAGLRLDRLLGRREDSAASTSRAVPRRSCRSASARRSESRRRCAFPSRWRPSRST